MLFEAAAGERIAERASRSSRSRSIVRVVEPAPPTWTRWPTEKPASIHERPSSRVTRAGVSSPSSNSISSCGVAAAVDDGEAAVRAGPEDHPRARRRAIVGSAAPRSSLSVLPSRRRRSRADATRRRGPGSCTSWPTRKPRAPRCRRRARDPVAADVVADDRDRHGRRDRHVVGRRPCAHRSTDVTSASRCAARRPAPARRRARASCSPLRIVEHGPDAGHARSSAPAGRR